jgi:hypothetical protein
MTFVVDGTNGLTFNDATTQASTATNASNISSGTLGKARLPTGSVLQVVYGSTGSSTSATTSTYVDTALTASITPTSSTSKILVTAYCGMVVKTANDLQMNFQILRGSTGIFLGAALNNNAAAASASNPTFVVLDSPATTSSTTYKVQIADRDNVGSVSFNVNGTATITLMEIAA